MQYNKYVLWLVFTIAITTYSCTRKKDKRYVRNFSGFVYSAIDSLPYKNTSFMLYHLNGGSMLQGMKTQEEVKIITTNDDGYFNVEFNVINTLRTTFICHPDNSNKTCEDNNVGFSSGGGHVDTLYVR